MKLDTLAPGATGAPTLVAQIQNAIAEALPGAEVQVTAGQPGHFSLRVRWARFAGQSRLACQRLVYKSIAHLMRGERAAVHAIDQLETLLPEPPAS